MTIEPELDDLEKLALKALLDHFEPTDHHFPHYAQGARAVTQALNGPIQFRAIRAWADDLEAYLEKAGLSEIRLTPDGLRARARLLEREWEAARG